MNKKVFETTLLFLLVISIFRSQYIADQFMVVLVAVPLVLFILFSLPFKILSSKARWVRPVCFWIIVFAVYGFLLREYLLYRAANGDYAMVHDGVVQTEKATRSFLKGKNPYSISYVDVFQGERFYPEGRPHPLLTRYVYSPMTFLVNVPFFLGENLLFGGKFDLRISLAIFLFLTAMVGSTIVKEKLLFWMLFLLNPLFTHSFFIGANDVLILFFIFSCIAFLYFKKISMATVFLALGFGMKLTIVPFVPLYFLYLVGLLRKKKDRTQIILRQLLIFIGISVLIYLPFILWDAKAFVDDVLLFPLAGGSQGYPITGFLGLPHLLASFDVVSSWTAFPFYIIQILVTLVLLVLMYYVLKRFPKLSVLCVLFVVFFILSFSFSRTFQPNYLDFLSQVLVLGSFIEVKRRGFG